METEYVLEVKELTTTFLAGRTFFNAIENVSFKIKKGETLGIVGESGCGKSVTSLSIMGLIKPPGKISHGQILFNGQDLLTLSRKQLRTIRGNRMAMIFQEPMTSLNPVYTIGNQLGEVLKIHKKIPKRERREQVIQLLRMVGIPRAEEIISEYPHQLSGGMRQRVMIAMAMACQPELLIADEPTTALDVTIQAQILELMKELQQTHRMSMIMITHDLGVVSQVCDRVIVMYAGRMVEEGEVAQILEQPKHPYTIGLLQSLPKRGQQERRLSFIPGMVPPPLQWSAGCRFAERCQWATKKCYDQVPPLFAVNEQQQAACWLVEEESK